MSVLVRLLIAFLIAIQGVTAHASAADPAQVAAEIKAAYLYKFGNYVDWPAVAFKDASSPIRIGVSGEQRLADILRQMVAGRTVNGREMEVQYLHVGDPVEGLHILFIGGVERARPADILAATRGRPILTVTDSEEAFAMGSMINFVLVDGRLRFDIAPRSKDPGGLRISSRLLSTARKVVPGPS